MSDIPALSAIQQLGNTYRALMSTFEASVGQSMPRWRILLNIYQHGATTQKQLAADLKIDPAALTRQLKAIEQQGLVQRRRDENDNRLSNVTLTTSGREAVEKALPARSAFIRHALSDLSATELEQLEQSLHRLEVRLRQF